jgi:hypothetical protein
MFAFLMLFPIIMVGLGIGIAIWSKYVARTMARLRPQQVSDLVPGYGVVWGHVEGAPLRAPLSGRRCAWFEAWVEELRPSETYRRRPGEGETAPDWERVFRRASDQPITMTDGHATCLVAPEGARVYETAWSAWEGDTEEPPKGAAEPELQLGAYTPPTLRVTLTYKSAFGDSPVRYRYVERYIMAGDPVFAMGDAEPRRARRRKDAAQTLPDGTTPFDAPAAPVRFRIRKPDTRQPFVISTQDPSEVHAENQLASTGGLILAGMGVFGAFVLWNLRFG